MSAARRIALGALAAVVALALAAAPAPAAQAKPTIVLVHGAFADASGWNGVTKRLQARGYTVLAPPNPLRGVSADAAYLRSFLSTVQGPIVLAGHSYGGVAITNAATGNANVKALVYIAAFAPAAGDTVQALSAQAPGAMLGPDALDIRPYPLPDGTQGQEGTIKLSVFREVFAGDLPRRQTAVLAASQRPASLVTLVEPSGPPAWETIPSWALIAGRDNTIGTANLRLMAKRAGATTVEVKGASHVVMMSRPGATTKLILRAVKGR
jgi:pimeloyl-ACP methyl ester carboxylesterase